MKVIYVIDSISQITQKVNMLKNRFGDNILYIVRNDLVSIFKTYGYSPNAVYTKHLNRVIHMLLSKSSEVDDVIVCYSSLVITDQLLNQFIGKILDKSRVVFVTPKYNTIERMCNSAYNVYVKSLFKVKDSLASPKLQFLPRAYVMSLLNSHFANKLFELDESLCVNMYVEDKEINKSLKVKHKFNKYNIIPIIIALLITISLILTLALTKIHYVGIIIFICLYVMDLIITLLLECKRYFDNRFVP